MMKKIFMGILCAGLLTVVPVKSHAQIEIIGDVIKKVIMAIDLRVQKLQTQTILLQDAQRQLDNVMQVTHLADITDWVEQQKDLYAGYYQELWEVKGALQTYGAVKEMIEKQARLITAYKQVYARLSQDSHFSAEELAGCVQVYQSMLQQSAAVMDGLSAVIEAFTTQMTDGDRLRMINDLSARIDRNYQQFEAFTEQNILLSLQRSKDMQDMNLVKLLYGIQ